MSSKIALTYGSNSVSFDQVQLNIIQAALTNYRVHCEKEELYLLAKAAKEIEMETISIENEKYVKVQVVA